MVASAEVHANAGETKTVGVKIRGREFANYADGWQYEPGVFDLHAGSSVGKLEANAKLTIN